MINDVQLQGPEYTRFIWGSLILKTFPELYFCQCVSEWPFLFTFILTDEAEVFFFFFGSSYIHSLRYFIIDTAWMEGVDSFSKPAALIVVPAVRQITGLY